MSALDPSRPFVATVSLTRALDRVNMVGPMEIAKG